MNEATIEATNPPISHPERPTATTSPQVTAPRNNQTAKSGTSQVGQTCCAWKTSSTEGHETSWDTVHQPTYSPNW